MVDEPYGYSCLYSCRLSIEMKLGREDRAKHQWDSPRQAAVTWLKTCETKVWSRERAMNHIVLEHFGPTDSAGYRKTRWTGKHVRHYIEV